jgi:hypothetical protein
MHETNFLDIIVALGWACEEVTGLVLRGREHHVTIFDYVYLDTQHKIEKSYILS